MLIFACLVWLSFSRLGTGLSCQEDSEHSGVGSTFQYLWFVGVWVGKFKSFSLSLF